MRLAYGSLRCRVWPARQVPGAGARVSLPTSQRARGRALRAGGDQGTLPPVPSPAPGGLPACPPALGDARPPAGSSKALHHRATPREAQLNEPWTHGPTDWAARRHHREAERQQRITDREAEVRLLKQRRDGRRGEAPQAPHPLAHGPAAPDGGPAPPPRRRGPQRGRPRHGRRADAPLPTTDATADLPPDPRRGQTGGQPCAPGGSASHRTTLIDVTGRAQRRRLRRRRDRPPWTGGTHPDLLPAPVPGPLLPQSALGVSVGVRVLLDKEAFERPTDRLLAERRRHGRDVALGTRTDGLQRWRPLGEPVSEARRGPNQQPQHGHGDETRWSVFAPVAGHVGHAGYRGRVRSVEVAVVALAMGRAPAVPEAWLGDEAQGIVHADRYRADPARKQGQDGPIP